MCRSWYLQFTRNLPVGKIKNSLKTINHERNVFGLNSLCSIPLPACTMRWKKNWNSFSSIITEYRAFRAVSFKKMTHPNHNYGRVRMYRELALNEYNVTMKITGHWLCTVQVYVYLGSGTGTSPTVTSTIHLC
jgi:hypothetical protein